MADVQNMKSHEIMHESESDANFLIRLVQVISILR